MKMPKKIKIGALEYTIREDHEYCERNERFGSSNHAYQEIVLDPAYTPERKEQTLIHEMLHMLDRHAMVKDDGNNLSESEVERLGSILYQVLKDNKLHF